MAEKTGTPPATDETQGEYVPKWRQVLVTDMQNICNRLSDLEAKVEEIRPEPKEPPKPRGKTQLEQAQDRERLRKSGRAT